MGRLDNLDVRIASRALLQNRFSFVASPTPGIAKPNRRQEVQRRGMGPAIRRGSSNQNIVGLRFRVLDLDVEETIVRERIRVPKFKLGIEFSAVRILPNEFLVRERSLRIAVQHRHVTVGRRRVAVEINFLHILAVISLRAGHAEKSFFQKRIALIPKRESETKPAFEV